MSFYQFIECGNHRNDLIYGSYFVCDSRAQAVRYVHHLLLQFHSFWSERNDSLACIFGTACADDQSGLLHPLKQRRDGIGIEHQTLSDIAHRLLVFFPQHEQNQVLRIGDP